MIENIDNLKDITLGAIYNEEFTTFKLWSPFIDDCKLCLYENWDDIRRFNHPMNQNSLGIWEVVIMGDLEKKYYTFSITINGEVYEINDPYSISTGPNCRKSVIVNLEKTNPIGWDDIYKPINQKENIESVIYETHVRDISIFRDIDGLFKGKFKGFDDHTVHHLKNMGITHIQLMPIFDYATVDEIHGGYNWGYDPCLFNAVEGSYSTNSLDSYCRIKELKEMIMRIHNGGLKVIMDVVYNHTYHSKSSNFNRIAPNYFYRMNPDGTFSNGSGCGNEIATERLFVKKFIIDSLVFWMKEYKIDGFRFDLLSLYDKETVSLICKELKKINPNVILYGEPWIGCESVLKENLRFSKTSNKGEGIGFFNDDFRNTVKGDNDTGKRGYIGGEVNKKLLEHLVSGSSMYCSFPSETINYLSSHDNLTLFDKIQKSFPKYDPSEIIRINGLCISILLTSIGIPFIHGGTEFLHSKNGICNSYNSGDLINGYKWDKLDENRSVYNYIKTLTDLRSSIEIYKINDNEILNKRFIPNLKENGLLVINILNDKYNLDYIIIHNGSKIQKELELPKFDFTILLDETWFDEVPYSSIQKNRLYINRFQTVVLKNNI